MQYAKLVEEKALVYASSPLTSRTRGGGQQPVAELLHLLPRSVASHRVCTPAGDMLPSPRDH